MSRGGEIIISIGSPHLTWSRLQLLAFCIHFSVGTPPTQHAIQL